MQPLSSERAYEKAVLEEINRYGMRFFLGWNYVVATVLADGISHVTFDVSLGKACGPLDNG